MLTIIKNLFKKEKVQQTKSPLNIEACNTIDDFEKQLEQVVGFHRIELTAKSLLSLIRLIKKYK